MSQIPLPPLPVDPFEPRSPASRESPLSPPSPDPALDEPTIIAVPSEDDPPPA